MLDTQNIVNIKNFIERRRKTMKGVLITIISAIGAIAALIGIKMLDLPGVITAILIIIVLAFVIFGVTKGMSMSKKVSTGEQTNKTSNS